MAENRISSKPSGATCLREGKGLLAPTVRIYHPKRGKNSPFRRYGHRSETDASKNRKGHISRTARPNFKCKGSPGILRPPGVQSSHLLAPPTRRSRTRRVEKKTTRARLQTATTQEPSIKIRRVRSQNSSSEPGEHDSTVLSPLRTTVLERDAHEHPHYSRGHSATTHANIGRR